MFRLGTRISCRCLWFVVFAAAAFGSRLGDAFFEKGFFASGNTLWDELYQKCGSRVSFHCVQDRLMNYINDTLDSDLRITDGINFVKTSHRFDRMIDADSQFRFGNGSSHHRTRTQRALKTFTAIDDNGIGNATEPTEPLKDQEEVEFGSFVRTVEKIENDLEATEKQESSSEPPTSNATKVSEEEEARSDNLVITSLNKVSDMLYDKTSNYLASHDLRLDLPQTFFGGSRMVVSPRGFDEDGGIILKLNFNPAETPRSSSIAKYFRKSSFKLPTYLLHELILISLKLPL